MTLKTDMLTDTSVFFNTDEFADSANYNGSGIAVVLCADSDGADSIGTTAMLYVKKSDVAAPAYGDTVVLGGNTWRVDQNKDGAGYKEDGYVWHLPLVRENRSSQWRR